MKLFCDAALLRRRVLFATIFVSCVGSCKSSVSQSLANNTRPTINAIDNQVAKSNGDGHFVRITGITAGHEEEQRVTLNVETDKNLFERLEIHEGANGSAFIQYQPKKGISGIATVTVTATDNYPQPSTVRRSFNIIIEEVGKAALPDPSQLTASQMGIELKANPNPVITTSRILFSTNNAEQIVSVDLYSLSGSKLVNLFRGNTRSLRNYNLAFSRGHLAAGTYLIKLTTAKHQQTLPLILQ